MVEVTGIAPVYQRKTTRLSPRTVCFSSRNRKKTNQLAITRAEKIFEQKRLGVTVSALFALSYTGHLTTQKRQSPRAGIN